MTEEERQQRLQERIEQNQAVQDQHTAHEEYRQGLDQQRAEQAAETNANTIFDENGNPIGPSTHQVMDPKELD